MDVSFQAVGDDVTILLFQAIERRHHFVITNRPIPNIRRSIDSRFDAGLALVPNGNINQRLNDPFPNFTKQENQGKNL